MVEEMGENSGCDRRTKGFSSGRMTLNRTGLVSSGEQRRWISEQQLLQLQLAAKNPARAHSSGKSEGDKDFVSDLGYRQFDGRKEKSGEPDSLESVTNPKEHRVESLLELESLRECRDEIDRWR